MHIELKNLGPLKHATFDLGDLTILCGTNNTGKTYATYALYGFLEYWKRTHVPTIPAPIYDRLYSNGKAILELSSFAESAETDLDMASKAYSDTLSEVFASHKRHFTNSSFAVSLTERLLPRFEIPQSILRSRDREVFGIRQVDLNHLELTLLVDKRDPDLIPPRYFIEHRIADAIKSSVYGTLIPRGFISSAERTGAAVFRKALDKARVLFSSEPDAKTPLEYQRWRLLQDFKYGYALPVQRNIEFNWQLEEISRGDSYLVAEAPHILRDFADILGGEYRLSNDVLYFVPKHGEGVRLTMDESSSSVRSLLDVGFYLRHVARRGDLLIIDEPELNLHPENQRRIARLLAALVGHGVKVFITTHSDYIVKEFNTLIMLSNRKKSLRRFREKNGYRDYELLSADRVKAYVTRGEKVIHPRNSSQKFQRSYFLARAEIDSELGIIAESFDSVIDEMNNLQQSILFEDEGVN